MKRIERNTYNSLRKSITADTICVEIPTEYTKEGRQGIHEMLTIEKHMRASSILWNDIEKCYCIHYVPCFDEYDNERRMEQEAQDIDEIMNSLPKSDTMWNGFQKPTEETEGQTNDTPTEEEQTMENTNTNTNTKKDSFEIRQIDAWYYGEDEGWIWNTSYLMGEMQTKAQNERRAFTAWLKRHLGISFKNNRTLIEHDGDCYTIIDRKTKEPLFIAIPQY